MPPDVQTCAKSAIIEPAATSPGEERPDDRSLAGEHVCSDADPVVAAGEGLDTSADAVLRLEHERVQVAELPGGGQPADAGAHDDDVLHGLAATALCSGTR